jgi:hypothetical protein
MAAYVPVSAAAGDRGAITHELSPFCDQQFFAALAALDACEQLI